MKDTDSGLTAGIDKITGYRTIKTDNEILFSFLIRNIFRGIIQSSLSDVCQ